MRADGRGARLGVRAHARLRARLPRRALRGSTCIAGLALAEGVRRAAPPCASPAMRACGGAIQRLEPRAGPDGGGGPPTRAGRGAASRRGERGRGRSSRPRRSTTERGLEAALRGAPAATGAGSRRAARLVVLLIVAIYVRAPEVVGLRRRGRQPRRRRPGTGSSSRSASTLLAFVAYVALFRGVLGGRAATTTCTGGSTWRASYQITMAGLAATRALLRRGRGRHRAHLLGAAQGRDARAGARPAGWSRSWCSPYSVYLRRWSCSACCCAPASCTARHPVAGTIVPGGDRRRR